MVYLDNPRLFICLPFLLILSGVCFGQTTERISVDSLGMEVDMPSAESSISADGRFVAFTSYSNNLSPNDNNNGRDIFVHDRATGLVRQVSVNSQGIGGDRKSLAPSISGDGRFVAFMSLANNLVPGDSNYTFDVFVHDCMTGVTERVSLDALGRESPFGGRFPSISDDGRFVAFESAAPNLVQGDSNGVTDVFVFDRQSSTTERVSLNSRGEQANDDSTIPVISGDGRYIAFQSDADNFVPGDWNSTQDIFIHDRQNNATKCVSLGLQGWPSNRMSSRPSISADGRFVAFHSFSDNLVVGDTNGHYGVDIFVYDHQTRFMERVSVSSSGEEANAGGSSPSISADGLHVAFMSSSDNLVPGYAPGNSAGIFVHDRQHGTTERVSVTSIGMPGESHSQFPSISAGGRHVSFESWADNLVTGDTNGIWDIFVHDRWNGLGANSIYLTGPISAPVGAPLELNWLTAPPHSDYWLGASSTIMGSVIAGHSVDLGTPFMLVASGVNTGSGAGTLQTISVPPSAAGSLIIFEVLARSADGTLYDSNAVPIAFY